MKRFIEIFLAAAFLSVGVVLADGINMDTGPDLSAAQTWANTQTFTKPIIVSTQSEVIVSTGNAHGSTNNKIRRYSNIYRNVGNDITYADSAGNGASFTINKAGWYAITCGDTRAGGAATVGISVNGTGLTTSIVTTTIEAGKRAQTTGAAGYLVTVNTILYLSAGDVVRPHDDGSADNTDYNTFFIITRIN